MLLGFAALTGDDDNLKRSGEDKRRRKGCDLMMVNPIDRAGQGFGQPCNGGWLLGDGWLQHCPTTSKLRLAHQLLDALLAVRRPSPLSPAPAGR